MDPALPLSSREVRTEAPSRSNPGRLLYPAAAVLLFVFMLLGFQQFYLRGQGYPGHPLAPPIKGLIIAHGVSMTLWVILFLVQPLLIVSGNKRVHMKVGILGAVLAVSMVLLGLYLPIQTTRFEPDVTLWGLNRVHFMAIPIFAILTFAGFVTLGIRNRRRPEIHRPMMLLATLAVIPAATDRITGLPELYAAGIWGQLFGPFFVAVLTGVVFLLVKWALTRAFDRWLALGLTALALVDLLIMRIAPTDAWGQFATFLVK